jgi:hypothetical protein
MIGTKSSKIFLPRFRGLKFMKFKTAVFNLGIAFLVFFVTVVQVFSQKKPDEMPLFQKVVESKLRKNYNTDLSKICPINTDATARRIFSEYGAIFVAEDNVILPNKCIFEDETQVQLFQAKAASKSESFGDVVIQLQEPAMNALLEAQKEAAEKNLQISPRGGSIAAKRSYQNTVTLWNSRFYPALDYWMVKGKISLEEVSNARNLPINEQVAQVLEWEKDGLYFSTGFTKSILFSVAAPGASQHIFMLALDVEQFSNLEVRKILAKHGWFQTVKSDFPHFTYLGVEEKDLFGLGLKPFLINGYKFWLTDFEFQSKKA